MDANGGVLRWGQKNEPVMERIASTLTIAMLDQPLSKRAIQRLTAVVQFVSFSLP